jgi:hypothetical protein
MFSLWKQHPTQKTIEKEKILQAPSLNLTKTPSRPVQGLTFLTNLLFFKQDSNSMEGTSPRTFFSRRWRASLTVEASLVLPLFLLFFLTLGSGMEMLRLHGKMEVALWRIGRETCLYGTVLQEFRQQGTKLEGQAGSQMQQALSSVGNLAFSYTYVKGRVEEALGKDYLEDAPIGKEGLFYLGGSIINQEDLVGFQVSYPVEPKWSLMGFRSFWMENHYYGRTWTGFELSETEQGLYYLTENAQVYHLDINCSHLKLSPEAVSKEVLSSARNARGSRYRACSICVQDTPPAQVWISPEGECYHYRRDCSGLKRTIRAVTWKEAEGYRPCSRCGK